MVVMCVTLLRVSAKSELDCDAFYGRRNGSTVVVCEGIRDRGQVGSRLLFTCGLSEGLLSAVYWHVEPKGCCSLAKVYRVTQTEPKRENADVQLTLKANKPVKGSVGALVVAASGEILLNASMEFTVTSAPEDASCRCKRRYMWCNKTGHCHCPVDRPHYDPVHGVCGSSVPLDGACRYHHQCQWNHSTLECLRGRCDCGYRAVRSTVGRAPRPLRAHGSLRRALRQSRRLRRRRDHLRSSWTLRLRAGTEARARRVPGAVDAAADGASAVSGWRRQLAAALFHRHVHRAAGPRFARAPDDQGCQVAARTSDQPRAERGTSGDVRAG
ncbi:hypothetical protein HPB50_019120 [Hyalomma asiaticum]|uniref:Uncharacterized protein n=1 Tax=Hyalomma asiaticum TaxID=266040 RepID=A0ACB7SS14_HYAAI|nr:hypothetical protein HPB50_019120 [Hyalomma asiaticum]